MFKVIVQDYREAFKRSIVPKRDQRFFLCGQMCGFLHRLLRRIVSRSCLPDEWHSDALRSFDFAVGGLFSIPEFMQKTEFRAKVLKVAGSKIDIERERGKKAKTDTVAKTVMRESFNPFIDQGRQYLKELLRHLTFKSDLVIGLACFCYALLFKLPKTAAVDCYQHVFQSFSSRGRVARELRNVHIDDYVEFVNGVRHVYLDELGVGPAVEDMVSYFPHVPNYHGGSIAGTFSNCVVFAWALIPLNCLMFRSGQVSLR